MNAASYDGTTSLSLAIANLGLSKPSNTNKTAALTQQAAAALGLSLNTTGGKKPAADCLVIYEWLRDNVANKAPAPTTVSMFDSIETTSTTDSLPVDSETESLNNQLAVFEQQGGIVSMAIDSLVNQIVKNADDGVDATIEQIQNVIKLQKSAKNIDRAAIYWHRQKRTFSQLGYESFEAFGLAEFDYSLRHMNQMANAYVVEKSLGAIAPSEQIPEGQLRPLSPIPENERAAIWEEANRKAEEAGKERTAKMVQDAVNEWKSKNESLQNDLVGANQAITEKEKRVKFLELDRDTFRDQNNQLRDTLAANIDAAVDGKLAEKMADLITKNSDAIQVAEKKASDAQDALEKLKKNQLEAIKQGVKIELQGYDNEIAKKQTAIGIHTREIEKLREVELSLEREVGALQTHKKSITKIKDNLSFLAVSFSDAFDTGVIPVDIASEWQSISYAIKKLDAQIDDFIIENSVVKAIEGELML